MPAEPTVFVIDDDPSALASVCVALSAFNMTVRPFDSAEAFLAAHDDTEHGCLLLDVRLKGIDGLELLRGLKETGTNLPAILISGNADKQVFKTATECGAVAVLEKPIDPRELVKLIRQTI